MGVAHSMPPVDQPFERLRDHQSGRCNDDQGTDDGDREPNSRTEETTDDNESHTRGEPEPADSGHTRRLADEDPCHCASLRPVVPDSSSEVISMPRFRGARMRRSS
jgi:hypothetical protein